MKGKLQLMWKHLFLGLLIVNVLTIVVIFGLIFWPIDDEQYKISEIPSDDESSEFVVRTTKKNLNELINAYIDKFLSLTNHHYIVTLDDDVHLLGEIPVFSTTVPLSIHLEPIVQENGDIILKQKSISVGLLQLPNKKIMEYIKKYLTMPEWVVVQPNEESIYVAISDMDIKSNFQVAVESFDLEANNLAFKIKVPYKTLGIESSIEAMRQQNKSSE
ncbi:MAG TPA: YpmS family protein [Bacillota bacterium]|nr:YpmS family protein [Bacillota bacterium]